MKPKKRPSVSNQYRRRRSAKRRKMAQSDDVSIRTNSEKQPEAKKSQSLSTKKAIKTIKKEQAKIPLTHEVDSQVIIDELDEKHAFHQKIYTKQKQRQRKHKVAKYLKISLFAIILVIIGIGLFYAFIYDIDTVDTKEMSGTIQSGEKVLYKKDDINRFRVVKVNRGGETFWSRVIGVPGDTLEMENDTLYVNGLEYEEAYLKNNYLDYKLDKKNISKNYTKSFKLSHFANEGETFDVIPDNKYVVLSDDRQAEVDSRYIGLIDAKEIEGVAHLIVWPPSKVGIVK